MRIRLDLINTEMNSENLKRDAGQLVELYTELKTISSTRSLFYSWVLLAKVAAFAKFSFAHLVFKKNRIQELAITNENMTDTRQQFCDKRKATVLRILNHSS